MRSFGPFVTENASNLLTLGSILRILLPFIVDQLLPVATPRGQAIGQVAAGHSPPRLARVERSPHADAARSENINQTSSSDSEEAARQREQSPSVTARSRSGTVPVTVPDPRHGPRHGYEEGTSRSSRRDHPPETGVGYDEGPRQGPRRGYEEGTSRSSGQGQRQDVRPGYEHQDTSRSTGPGRERGTRPGPAVTLPSRPRETHAPSSPTSGRGLLGRFRRRPQ